MSRRKRYIKGKVFITNNNLLTNHNKANRRIVVINNNPEEAHVKRILTARPGSRTTRKGIPIEKYPDIPKNSVVENKTFRRTIKGERINTNRLKKTKTRLNKWDMAKLVKKK